MATKGETTRDQPPTLLPADRGMGRLYFAFTVLLLYLAGGFLLDDYFHLERASRPFGVEALRFAIHTEDHGIVLWPRATPVHVDFLRPLTSLSLWLEFRIWGLHAWGYHADNLLLHILNVWLLVIFARRLRLQRASTVWVAVAWGVSLPAAPAVGWISGRTELLSCFFVLSSVLALDRWIVGGRSAWFPCALLLSAMAPLAKESGVVAPVLIVIAARLRDLRAPGSARRKITPWIAAALFIPALAYLWVRFGVLQIPPPPPPYLQPFSGSLSDVGWLLGLPGVYLVSALLSLPLSHVSPLATLRDAPILLALIGAVGLALLRAPARAAGLGTAALLVAWFVAGILPYLPVIPTSLYLYLPLAGLTLLLGVARDARPGSRWPTRWLAALVAAGVVAQLAIATFTISAARALAGAATVASEACRSEAATRLVLLDTPVWAYGLSAAARLRNPQWPRVETWLVNFSPSVRPGPPSRLQWRDRLLLEARPATGRYFDSPFEQFLLFGGSPMDTLHHVHGDALRARPDSLVERPGALQLRFRDMAALEQTSILQFNGWSLARVAPPPAPLSDSAAAPGSSGRLGSLDSGGPATAP